MTGEPDTRRALATKLLVYEAEGSSDPSRMAAALDRACRKLHSKLAWTVGDVGVRAIVRRAIAMTQPGFPFLAADPVPGGDEYLKGLRESLEGQNPAAATEVVTVLLANFLGLVEGMLGKGITYTVLSEAWPEGGDPLAGLLNGSPVSWCHPRCCASPALSTVCLSRRRYAPCPTQ